MMNREDIRKEIEFEMQLLANYKAISSRAKQGNLIYQERAGRGSFVYCRNWKSKRQYLKKDDPKIEELYRRRFSRTAIDVLNDNVRMLKELERIFKDFDIDTVNALLPKAYRKAYELIVSRTPQPGAFTDFKGTDVIQSENPKNREQLKHRVSNGLMVRSKNEMLIEEQLISYGLRNQYEKALTLEYTETDEFGNINYRSKTVYPDFTIFLENGDCIYWEHEGMMEFEDYRKSNIDKLNLYFMNGIYIPDKLIVTMDGRDTYMDTKNIQSIIEDFILPRIDDRRFL